MNKELQKMNLLLSEFEQISKFENYQQYDTIIQTFQSLEIFIKGTQTIEGSQFLPQLVFKSLQLIMNHKQYPENILNHIEKLIQSVLLLISRNISDDRMSNIFLKIMDPSSVIYQYNALSTNCHEDFMAYSYQKNLEYKLFIDNLKVGSRLDCIRICSTTNRVNWNRGVVEERNEEYIKVRYLNELQNSQIYNIKSGHLMPILSRSQNLDQMFNLQNQQVLLAALNDKWVLSTILDRIVIQDVQNITTYIIRFNLQLENDNTSHARYYEEQINACSPRLALCGNQISRKFNSNEIFVDDSYDTLYEYDYKKKKFYAILRPNYSQSMLLIKFINYFGSIGGFEQILRLQSVDTLANYIQAIGNIHAQIYRSFCYEYIPKLQGLRQTLLQSDDSTLRNLGQGKIYFILQAFKLLLDRIMSEESRKEWIQSIGLEFVQICFNCKFLDKKIIALKILTDLLKQAYNDQSPGQIIMWIEKQQILENLLHHDTHLQLLERTKDLIKIYLSINGAFNFNYLSIVWNLMQSNDNELRSIVFKVFIDLATFMSDQQVNYFLEKIQKLELNLIVIEHVQLLFEMQKQRFNQKILNNQTMEILWNIIEYAALQQKTKLEDQSRNYLIELIKFLNVKDIKIQMIQKLIANIKQQSVENSSLKILSEIICKFLPQTSSQHSDEDSKNEFITVFIEQEKIHYTLIDNIDNLYKQNQGINVDNINEKNLYINKLQERLLLINTLIMIKGSAADMIDQQFLDLIWKKHIQKPNFNQESDVVSQWFKNLIEKDENFSSTQLYVFFERLLKSDSKMNENAFKCFKSILYYVNQKDYRIERQSLIFKQLCDQYGNLLSIENANDQEKEDQMDYKIMVDVNQIIGIDYLWFIVLDSYLEQAIQLLVKLNLSQQEQFIGQVISKLKTDDEQIILRCFDIIRELLKETERQGIGTQLALDGLVRGNQFIINLIMEGDQNYKLILQVYQNMTIFELRKLIAKQIQTSWQQVKLIKNEIVILDTDNGKTLRQLNIKKMDTIQICKRNTQPIQKVSLVQNNKLSPIFLKVLNDLFNQYSTNGKMNIEQHHQFLIKASNNQNIQFEQMIQKMFNEQNIEGQYITLYNFISFFEDYCLQQQNVGDIWWNLYALGYKNDLSLINDDNFQIDEYKLPRFQLVQNEEFYQIMFDYLKKTNKVAQECWKLLCLLPVFEQARQRVNSFEDIVKDESYQLLYSLKVIDYLLYNQEYCRFFIIRQGFKTLQNILNNLEKQNSIIRRQCQRIILKIFIKHIAAQYQSQYNIIFQIQQSVKLPHQVTLDLIGQFINGNIQKQENQFIQKVQERESFLEILKFTQDLDIQLDYKDLFNYLINTPVNLQEDLKLIEYVLILLTTLVGFNLNNSRNFFIEQINQIKQRYKQFMFASGQLIIQKFTINSFYLIYRYQKDKIGKLLIQVLKELFPSNDNKDSQYYFDLLAKLIEEEKYSDQGLANNIIQQLQNYEPNESRQTLSCDKTLIGLLSILESLCKIDSKILSSQLIKYLYTVHLFCFDMSRFNLNPQQLITPNYVKSKSPESRKVVYRIIILYLRQNFNYQEIDLNSVIFQIQLYESFDIKMQIKSNYGYVGIRNLGCICYMNAMIQQFFMTPEFRYCMMRADDEIEQQVILIKGGADFEQQIDNNHFHQFQRMLAYLDLSDRQDFNPLLFCLTYKDSNNQQFDFSLQQDTQEFLNHFFDSLDNELKIKGWQQFIEAIYGGQICSQMICNLCQCKREKFDLFYTLSLKVKDVKSIQESFESMINGEVIKDYYCEECHKKNDFIKRQCLSNLPNVLIVHLQRIVYNLDLQRNEKLSSYLEFPNLLNLLQYTREGLSNQEFKHDSYYQYKLKGVVVHHGTALQGHYYSLINTQGEKWLKFNDSIIEEFDIKQLPNECFGGNQKNCDPSEFQDIGISSTNAYILLYERIHKEKVQLKFSNYSQKLKILSKFKNQYHEKQNSNLIINMDFQTMSQQFISDELYSEIWLDNHKFMLERHIYSEEFFRFVKEITDIFPYPSDYQLVTDLDHLPQFFGIYNQYQQVQNADQIAYFLYHVTYISTELLSQSSDHIYIKEYTLAIINLINIVPNNLCLIFQQLFLNRQQRFFNVLLCAPYAEVREAIQQIMLHYLNVIIYIYSLMLNTQHGNQQDQNNHVDNYDKNLVHFLINILQLLQNDAAKYPTQLNQYFNFWKMFVQSSQVNLFFANQLQLISILADFYMGNQSPQNLENNQFYSFKSKEKTINNNQNNPTQYSSLFQCINYLLQNEYYQLSNNDKICLNSNIFYKKALKESQDLDSIIQIIQKMAFNNCVFSRCIIEIVLEEINNSNYEAVGKFLKLAQMLLNIFDNTQLERIQMLLGYPQPYYQDNYITGCSTNISQQSIVYISNIGSLNENISILNQLFFIRKADQNSALQMIRMLLDVMRQNKQVFLYIINLPPPSYLYSKYTDWFEVFLNEFQNDYNKQIETTDSIFFNRKLEFEQTIKLWEEYKINFYQMTQLHFYHPLQPLYIVGHIIKTDLVSREAYMDNVFLETYESLVYYLESNPTFVSNQAFPPSILKNNIQVQTSSIQPTSNIFNILLNDLTTQQDFSNSTHGFEQNISTNEIGYNEQEQVNNDFINELQSNQHHNQKDHRPRQTNKENKNYNNLQQFQQQQLIQCNLPIQVASIMKRLMINNSSNQTIQVICQINQYPNMMINFILPKIIFKVIPPYTVMYLTTLMKIAPSKEWGIYDIALNINSKDIQKKKQEKNNQQQVKAKVKEPQKTIEKQNEIQCPKCTLLQSSSNSYCELCTFSFE